jgi:signal transduction histidine kinase/DNA-binding response OmpR family regulator
MKMDEIVSSTPQQAEVAQLATLARECGTPDPYRGKRRWTRYAVGMTLEAKASSDPSAERWQVVTHNISGGGIGFWSKQKLPPRSKVWLREWTRDNSAPWLPALVMHCIMGIRGYLIGARFDDACSPDETPGKSSHSNPAVINQGGQDDAGTTAARWWHSLGAKCALASAAAGIVGLLSGILVLTQVQPAAIGVDISLASIGIAAALAGLVGWGVIRGDIRFLNKLQLALRRIARGESARTLGIGAPSKELAQLHGAFMQLETQWREREHSGEARRHKLEELNQVKSNILSIVSHDLRTPLTSILLYAKMLNEELESLARDDQRRFLGIISNECNRLARLVDDLLEVQRLESGRVKWDIQKHDLSETIHECAQVFKSMAFSKSIELELDCPDSLPPVEVDSDKISQVLSNLLSNALKYTPGGGCVRLSAKSNANEILICVADTGPGIPRDKWDQIFGRFTQLSNANTREIAGVGLGLHIVREIVEAHGGAVWVDSEIGQGSEFFVSLPVKRTGPKLDAAPQAESCQGRIVVCDADPQLAAMIAQTLRANQFHVSAVHSGCRLLAQLEQTDAQVVVTDLLLPDVNASELLEALNASKPRPYKLIVHSFAGNGPELRRRGVDVVLQRPATRDDLLQAVHLAMRQQRTRGRTVLVVTTDADQRRLINDLLAKHGHLPIAADRMSEATQRCHVYPLDAILIAEEALRDDWSQLEKLRSVDGETGPVAILCNRAGREKQRRAEANGVQLICGQQQLEREILDLSANTGEAAEER